MRDIFLWVFCVGIVISSFPVNDFVDDNGSNCFKNSDRVVPVKLIHHGCGLYDSVWKVNDEFYYGAKIYNKKNFTQFDHQLYIHIKMKRNRIQNVHEYKCHASKHRIILFNAIIGCIPSTEYIGEHGYLGLIYQTMTKLSRTINELHRIDIYFVNWWNIYNVVFDKQENVYLVNFGDSETIDPITKYWLRNNWFHPGLYLGNGFRQINFIKKVNGIGIDIVTTKRYAIMGDNSGFGKLVIQWIFSYCKNSVGSISEEIEKYHYQSLCLLAEQYIDHMRKNQQWLKIYFRRIKKLEYDIENGYIKNIEMINSWRNYLDYLASLDKFLMDLIDENYSNIHKNGYEIEVSIFIKINRLLQTRFD